MIAIKELITLLMLSFMVKLTGSDGALSLKLIHFDNRMSKLDDGTCCDKEVAASSVCSPCQCSFLICLSPQGQQNCSIKRILTDTVAETEYYVFKSSLRISPSQVASNPLVIPIKHWTGNLSIRVDVFDRDLENGSSGRPNFDLVTKMQQNLSMKATEYGRSADIKTLLLLGKQRAPGVFPMVTLQMSIQCNKNYFVPTCSEYCTDTNNATGHYKCDYTRGTRQCFKDWYGLKCQTQCIARNDSSGHFKCHSKTGAKICLAGWFDPTKRCTQREKPQLALSYSTSQIIQLETSTPNLERNMSNGTSVLSTIHSFHTQISSSMASLEAIQQTTGGTQALKASSKTSILLTQWQKWNSASVTKQPGTISRMAVAITITLSQSYKIKTRETKTLQLQTSAGLTTLASVVSKIKKTSEDLASKFYLNQTHTFTKQTYRAPLSKFTSKYKSESSALACNTTLPTKPHLGVKGRIWVQYRLYFASAIGFFVFVLAGFCIMRRKKRQSRVHNVKEIARITRRNTHSTSQHSSCEMYGKRTRSIRSSADETSFPATSAFQKDQSEIIWRERLLHTPQGTNQGIDSQHLPPTPVSYERVCLTPLQSRNGSFLGAKKDASCVHSGSASDHIIVGPPGTPFESRAPSACREEARNLWTYSGVTSQNRNFLTVETAFLVHSSVNLPRTPTTINYS